MKNIKITISIHKCIFMFVAQQEITWMIFSWCPSHHIRTYVHIASGNSHVHNNILVVLLSYIQFIQSTLCYTVNGETLTGLNFRDIHSIWIFTVIHSQYKARDQYMFILRAKIHRKNFCASLKDHENHKSLAQ